MNLQGVINQKEIYFAEGLGISNEFWIEASTYILADTAW